MKLKTLKGLEEHTCMIDDCCREELYDSLKQEAIKWIKDIRENMDENIPSGCHDTVGLICWIKHFFDIIEEDLKR